MRILNCLFTKVLPLALVAGLLVACGGKEERKAQYLERGKNYLAEENYNKAMIEFKNVLQIDPKTAEAYMYVGEVLKEKRDWPSAFANYKKAIDLDPDLVEARIVLAKIYVAQSNASRLTGDEESGEAAAKLANEQIDEILSREPENLEGLTVQAHAWVQDGERERAVQQLEKVIAQNPELPSAALLLAGLYDAEGRTEDAETVLVRAIVDEEGSVPLQKRLAEFYRKNGRLDTAEKVLRDIVSNNPELFESWVSLASFLAQSEQKDRAEEVLREAIETAPEDFQRYRLLADFISSSRGVEAAISELAKFVERKPDSGQLKFILASFYLKNEQAEEAKELFTAIYRAEGNAPDGLKAKTLLAQTLAASEDEAQLVQAKKLVAEVLKENPQDNLALLLKGKFAANEKKYDEAIAAFRSILKDQPGSSEVLRLLAAAHMENGEIAMARDTLGQAVEKNPGEVRLRLGLAQLLAQTGDTEIALEHVNEVIRLDHDNEEALSIKFALLNRTRDEAGMEAVAKQMQSAMPGKEDGFIREARMRLGQGDHDQALTIVEKMLEKNPESLPALLTKAEVLAAQERYADAIPVVERVQALMPEGIEGTYRKATLLEKLGRKDEAKEQYEIALAKKPESIEILAALVTIDLRDRNFDGAIKRLTAVLEENAEHRTANGLLGRVYAATGDYVNADNAFQRQINNNPQSLATYSDMALTRRAQDNLQGAIHAYEAGLAVAPNNTRLLVELASVREQQKDFEAAIALYERVLEKQPDNVLSMNNVAVLLAEHRSDVGSHNKAEKLAERLAKSSEPVLLDTAGWVYYRKGNYEEAVNILEKAVENSPEVPTFRYHLGMAYFKQGDKNAAREHLAAAVTDDASYDGIEEARATLESL